jgi:hypothetical protein
MREQRRCHTCKHLYTKHNGFGRCWYNGRTSNPNKKACRYFHSGPPYLPKLNGHLAKLIRLDPSAPQSWIWYISATQALVVAWTMDRTGRPCWEIKPVGLRAEGGLHTKQFTTTALAFYGETMALGAGENALWTSFGFEDADQHDEDGVVKNKPRVIRIYPVEERRLTRGSIRRRRKHGG